MGHAVVPRAGIAAVGPLLAARASVRGSAAQRMSVLTDAAALVVLSSPRHRVWPSACGVGLRGLIHGPTSELSRVLTIHLVR